MESNKLKNEIALAKKASVTLLDLSEKERKAILLALSKNILKNKNEILKANTKDIKQSQKKKNKSFVERLTLNKIKIESMAQSVMEISKAQDILFKTLLKVKRPSGIKIKKVVYPLGLIGVIYESRPNVTVDAFALAFKSGNGIILKGGKEISNTNKILVDVIKQTLGKFNVNKNIIKDFSGIGRNKLNYLLKNPNIDCIIPRGGKNLIEFVSENTNLPVIITGASVVHTYIDLSADLEMAKKIILNAKARRVSICNALDVLLVHKEIIEKFLKISLKDLAQKNIEIRAEKKICDFLKKNNYPKFKLVTESDFDTEFLDYILAVKTTDNYEMALEHIKKHSLGHSEAIITKSKKQIEKFFQHIDAACLYVNTSTQFSDGSEFGMGGEIGISTQKLHARGPFGFQELTTYKYLIESPGAIRK
ncbi:MAG TPA: glutamate-5-semialdehyde dehydrogenase [Patescibacteria group bacterium]|nr:glutamate-5-semialdehyde dehydrogenase [Patescibacteria group bacterium]